MISPSNTQEVVPAWAGLRRCLEGGLGPGHDLLRRLEVLHGDAGLLVHADIGGVIRKAFSCGGVR